MENCQNCKNALLRCEFSFKKYGSYAYPVECVLPENERTPFRRLADTCEKYADKEE